MPKDRTSLLLLVTFLVLAASGAVLAALAARYDEFFFDEPLIKAVQRLDWFEPLAHYGNEIQHYYLIPIFWVASILALLWRKQRGLALLFVLMAAAPALNDELIKETVGRPRPAGDFAIRDDPSTYSFPSGHVMRSVAFFGLWFAVAGEVLRPRLALAVRVAAVLLILLVALSRMWDGVHWPSDTLGSIVIGGAHITLLLLVRRRLSVREWLPGGRDGAARGP